MFARQCLTLRCLSRKAKSCPKLSVIHQQVELSTLTVALQPKCCITPAAPLHNARTIVPCTKEKDNGETNNPHNSSGFLMAGILGLLKAEPEDKEKPAEEQIIQMIKRAKLCHQRKEYKKSEQFLHLALRTAYEMQHHNAERYIIDEMANNAYEIGDFKKAEKLFKETVSRLLSDGVFPEDNAIIHISAKLANLCGIFNEELKAREGFKFCINHLEAKIKQGIDDFDTMALYSLTLSWFAEFLHTRGVLEESLRLFQKAHEVSVKINGAHHPHSLLQLNNMAASYTLMNKLDEAVDCLNSALLLAKEHQMDEGENDLPYYHINLANIYLTQVGNPTSASQEMLTKALVSCREAIRAARRIGNREALMEADKCMAKIKEYQKESRIN